MTHPRIRPHLVRPAHTGTARTQAARTQTRAGRHPTPTHQRLPQAAVALDPGTPAGTSGRSDLFRRAARPLLLSQGRRALALRQAPAGPLEVLVQTRCGQRTWRPVAGLLTPDVLRTWVREGFSR